ncbi:holo-ACP synthase [Effusibacillus dendaii]|uniref:Holo-[acyl-carrier-protein] synthase n=1 Tax=Effusibacillus dendaii TaxID=2743772 RepID=A0A7I8DD81_9BACL|nr:holo-ACP synthase [Effusibacillus dendaii]BCJ88055.1 holo-[acyl-carrier-protein] synthase [Effusibacillus dendaii]
MPLIGVDLVEIRRIAESSKRDSFLKRIYTENELLLLQGVSDSRRLELLAGRFAAKEAVSKALGTGIAEQISFRDIETLHGSGGEPIVLLYGAAKQRADLLGVTDVKVSISHTAELAIAYIWMETA